jgi:hypothetical protein
VNLGFNKADFPTLLAMLRGLFSAQGWKRTGHRFIRAARWTGRLARKAAKPIGAVIVLLLAVHAVLMVVWGRQLENRLEQIRRRGEPVTCAELAPRPIPDSENGALVYERAFKLIDTRHEVDLVPARYYPISNYLSSTHEQASWNQLGPTIRRIVRQAAPVYPLIRRATSYPKCSFQVNWTRGPSAYFLHPGELLQIERLQVAKAVVEAKDGHSDSAIDNLRIALRVCSAGSAEPSMLFPLLRSANIGFSYVGLNTVANIHVLTRRQASEIYKEMSEMSLRPGFMIALRSERTMTAWVFDEVRNDWGRLSLLTTSGEEVGSPGNMGKAWNKVMTYLWRPLSYKDEAIALDYWEKQLRLASLPYRKTYTNKWTFDPYVTAPKYALVTRRYFPVFSRAVATRDRAEAQLAIARVAMALHAYKDHFASYPDSLAVLSAKLGWALPEDPFSGKPLIYKRTGKGFKLYSFGPDLKDSGGLPMEAFSKPNNTLRGDIVWEQTR